MIYKTLDRSSMTGQQGIQMHQQLPVNKCTCKVALENIIINPNKTGNGTVKAKFHYASWFEASRRPASKLKPASNQLA